MNTKKRTAFLLAALLLSAPESFAQLDPQLRADVRETGFIHRPLPVREDKSFEQAAALKPALVVQNDPELTGNLIKVAQEDFAFAKERYDRYGYEELRMTGNRGHLSMTSESQYHASISWSASMLYKLTGKPEYAAFAAEAISYTLACQETRIEIM